MLTFISYLQTFMADHTKSDRGATAVEYGLLVTFIAIVMGVGATLLGIDLQVLFTNVL